MKLAVGQSLLGLRRAIDQTVALAQLGSTRPAIADLASILEDLQLGALADARGRGVRFEVASVSAVLVFVDRPVLVVALTALVELAVQSAARGGRVAITVREELARVELCIATTGEHGNRLVAQGADLTLRNIAACGGEIDFDVDEHGPRCRVTLQRPALA